jgi:diguanylate cyclase (GGDEF)-like protein
MLGMLYIMYNFLTIIISFTAISFLCMAIFNAYKIKIGISSIKNKKTYLFVISNIITALLLIIFYLIFIVKKINDVIDYQDVYVSFLFLLSSIFIFIASIVTHKMGKLLYKIDQLRITDPLTGVYNRGYIETAIQDEYNRCIRYKKHSCLLMIDINDFKKINDTYGHLTGDKILIHLVESIKPVKRKADLTGRFGGDEFIVLMPESMVQQAELLTQRIKDTITKNPLVYNDKIIAYSVSIGISDINIKEDSDYITWLHKADINLYHSKLQ